MTLANKTYDFIRVIVQVWLPAFATAYAALASLWGWGFTTQIVGTITALTTLLGTMLGISRRKYSDGDLVVNTTDPDSDVVGLSLAPTLGELGGRKTITLNVVNPSNNRT